MTQRYRLGIDVGGTFTDVTLMEEATGGVTIFKTSTTPESPSRAILEVIRILGESHGVSPADIVSFVHGTTLASNTILERKGARTGLLVTRGFRDILNLQRYRLPDAFNFQTDRPEPLVPRQLVAEVAERRMATGRAHVPLDPDQAAGAAASLVGAGIEALAIAFLHAFRDPTHEQAVRDLVRARWPELFVCTSAEVWPQIREYERSLLTVMNAYIGRRMEEYFTALGRDVAALGVPAPVLITKSNGGVMSIGRARVSPVESLLSGPASGVVGAHQVARLAGFPKVITFDMGGTSTDVAVVSGAIPTSTESTVGDFPVIMPVVDVSSIGAGGGSIARVEAAGGMAVGPQSAGADPGPACYGRGGAEPTVTDAYVVAGFLDPTKFLGGSMRVDPTRAAQAIGRLAGRLGRGVLETAEAILRVATAHMYAKLVTLLAQRGADKAEFALMAFGGAGPTHAFLAARELGIDRVLVPYFPGTFCALGCLLADARSDFIRTVYLSTKDGTEPAVGARLAAVLQELDRQAERWLAEEGIAVEAQAITHGADMRYLGQSFEIPVSLDGAGAPAEVGRRLAAAFYDAYEARYGYRDTTSPLEIINLRATVTGVTRKPALPTVAARDGGPPLTPAGRRRIFLDGAWHEATIYERAGLRAGDTLAGPAIVEQYDTTTVVPAGFTCRVDRHGNVVGEWTRSTG